ncbi:hypothetical protein WR25_04123 isoform A [Diploscapter pachys]|uniref:MADF domain-containing protein n=1 Tax=Diploscapter pachys TaxID=2018661 RepID=A0A2A2KTM0_9BILA|nr:hypothetical protein WR25_04123 isoform A [Diploscapter pachys]
MAQWTDASRSFLIREIQGRKLLWDKVLSQDGSLKTAKLLAFQEIAAIMNEHFQPATDFTIDDIRSQWKNLKDTFIRKQRWLMEGKYSDDPLKEPTWKFYRMLSFLVEKHPRSDAQGGFLDIASLQQQHGLGMVRPESKVLNALDDHPPHSSPDASNQSATSSSIMAPILNQCEQLIEERDKAKANAGHEESPPPAASSSNSKNFNGINEQSVYMPPSKKSLGEKHSYDQGTGSDEDEPRRKRPSHHRSSSHTNSTPSARAMVSALPQTPIMMRDNFDIFGELVADQLRRLSHERSRNTAMRLQWRISDMIRDSQNELGWS